MRKAEAQHWITVFQDTDDPKYFWGIVKKFRTRKKRKHWSI